MREAGTQPRGCWGDWMDSRVSGPHGKGTHGTRCFLRESEEDGGGDSDDDCDDDDNEAVQKVLGH